MTLVTPPIDNPDVKSFATEIAPHSKLVKAYRAIPEQTLPIGNCYWNVNFVQKICGGSMQLGWLFAWQKEKYIEAMHHAVWKGDDGKLVDLTAIHSPDAGPNWTVFLPDNRIPVDLTKNTPVKTRYRQLKAIKGFEEYIQAYDEAYDAHVRLAQCAIKAGYRNENNFAQASGEPLRPTELDGRYIAELGQLQRKHAEAQAKLGYHFRNLGS